MERQEKIDVLVNQHKFDPEEMKAAHDNTINSLYAIATDESIVDKNAAFDEFLKAGNNPNLMSQEQAEKEKEEKKAAPKGSGKKSTKPIKESDSVFANRAFGNPNLMSKKEIDKHNRSL